jgi:hypothetical protein
VLLPEKPDAIEHLPSARSGLFQTGFKIGVLAFQPINVLGADTFGARNALQRLHSRFGLLRPLTKRCQLVAEMADELLEVAKCGQGIRRFVA